MISAKPIYGLKALVEIAICGQNAAHILGLAKKTNAPVKYLEQVLAALSKAGILNAKRGIGGGYRIARSLSDICVIDILKVLEGKNENDLFYKAKEVNDSVDEWLKELSKMLILKLEGTTLEDLVENEKIIRQCKASMYYI